jgi:hypothetical protein
MKEKKKTMQKKRAIIRNKHKQLNTFANSSKRKIRYASEKLGSIFHYCSFGAQWRADLWATTPQIASNRNASPLEQTHHW